MRVWVGNDDAESIPGILTRGAAASCGLYSAKRLDGLQLGKLGIAGSVTYEDLANPGMEFVEPCLFWPKVCTGGWEFGCGSR
ncbi:MAG: hypothetical protein OHK0021_03930 [Bryobacter sp.]